MIRAAIYARFSSDLQSDRSIEDQIALCREVAAREGMAVVMTFEDRAVSGASVVNRPGFGSLMRAAEAKLFDVLVAEDIDRISRDQADYHAARKQLDFLGIGIHTASGKVTRLDGALRALMGEMYLENLALHVRRGLEGVVRDGRHAGGRAYGYRPIAGKPGELQIVEAEADVVRGIFAAYAAGETPRAIASDLNARGIAPPRGARWNASTINGNPARGYGILHNAIYVGRIVWNRVRMIKDPATGKRISRTNPASEHKAAAAPHLRIIDDDLWRQVQEIKARRSRGTPQQARKSPRVLSGLLKCGCCGAGMSSYGAKRGRFRVICSGFREGGSCTNGRRVDRDAIERTVLDTLRANLLSPAVIAEYVRAYNAERNALARRGANDTARLRRRAGEISRELDRLVDAIARGVAIDDVVGPRMKALHAERQQVDASLADLDDATKVVSLHPAAIDRYCADVTQLAELLAEGRAGECDQLIATIRTLIDRVVVHAPQGQTGFKVEIFGRLGAVTDQPMFRSCSGGGGSMVAGGRSAQSPPLPQFILTSGTRLVAG